MRTTLVSLAVAAALTGGCMGGKPDSVAGDDDAADPGTDTGSDMGSDSDAETGSGSGSGSDAVDEWAERLNQRTYNYPAALRTAALRLTGELPTVTQIRQLMAAPDAKSVYEGMIAAMLTDARFQRQALAFWRDTFKMGGTTELDVAPTFATQLTVNNGSSDQLFVSTSGVLTNPGVMKQFAGNLAFRRTRWVQETFDCTAFPAEVQAPQPVGTNNAPYTAPWPFASIAGTDNGGRIDFHDTSAVVCANCHATMNHIAPLFANFDANGVLQTAISVQLPTEGRPTAARTDWLPAGEPTAWRYNVPAPTLAVLGQVMAADPKVATCTVARVWNFALGKGDIVQTLSVVPPDVISTQVVAFGANGHKLRDLFYSVFTSDDFTRY